MKAQDIISLVLDAIQDSSFTEDDVLRYINQCCLEIAASYDIPSLVADKRIDIPSGSISKSLPSSFSHKLFSAFNVTDKQKISIHNSLSELLARFPSGDAGPIRDIAVSGSKLYLATSPQDACVIRVFFYSLPSELTPSDEPSFIPAHLHYPILFNFACAQCFNLIEDGTDGAKINHNKYLSFYTASLIQLEQFCNIREGVPTFVINERESSDFDGLL